jgi:hypothetical protein
MPIISIIVTLIIVGVLLWLANTYIPMDPTIKRILNVVVIILIILWFLSMLFDFGSLGRMGIYQH